MVVVARDVVVALDEGEREALAVGRGRASLGAEVEVGLERDGDRLPGDRDGVVPPRGVGQVRLTLLVEDEPVAGRRRQRAVVLRVAVVDEAGRPPARGLRIGGAEVADRSRQRSRSSVGDARRHHRGDGSYEGGRGGCHSEFAHDGAPPVFGKWIGTGRCSCAVHAPAMGRWSRFGRSAPPHGPFGPPRVAGSDGDRDGPTGSGGCLGRGRDDGAMSTITVDDVPLAAIDLSDVEFWLQPEAHREGAFRTLRREAPVTFFPEREFPPLPAGPGYWSLTRYDDIWHGEPQPPAVLLGAAAPTSPTCPSRSPSSSAR